MDLELLRAATPGTAHRLHLNHAGAGLLSTATLHTVRTHLDLEAHIGGYEAQDAAHEQIADIRAALADLVGGRADEIALFDGSTRAWQAAFHSVPLTRGDRVVTTRHEYGNNIIGYSLAAERTGVEVVVAPDDETGQVDVAALADLVDERTKLISLTWVPTSGGLVNPAAEVGAVARAAGVPYLVDATQVVGQLPIDVDAIGADLLTGTGRKFLRGPRGTGFLWARTSVLDRLAPHVAEIQSVTGYDDRTFTWAPGARRFEAWERNWAAALGLGSAVRQALDLGLDVIGRRVTGLGADLRQQLGDLSGVRVHDEGAVLCGIVTASLDRLPAADVKAALAAQGINVSVTVPQDHLLARTTAERTPQPLVRFSPHYLTTDEELTRAVAAVEALARG